MAPWCRRTTPLTILWRASIASTKKAAINDASSSSSSKKCSNHSVCRPSGLLREAEAVVSPSVGRDCPGLGDVVGAPLVRYLGVKGTLGRFRIARGGLGLGYDGIRAPGYSNCNNLLQRIRGGSHNCGFRSSAVVCAKTKVGPSGSTSGHRYKGKKNQQVQDGESSVPKVSVAMERQAAFVAAAAAQADVVVEIFEGIPVAELAFQLKQPVDVVQTLLAGFGEPVGQTVGADAAELAALEFGMSVKKVVRNRGQEMGGEGAEVTRSPVVTVMGHVDHGKTTLLDALRQTSVAAREAGGITQHLGAFVVSMPSGGTLTFLDTPGHAAFSSMRARGTAVTDIVVLVVAADDGVMPQTLEAMNLAQEAGVPMVVALTKCDRVEANPTRVRQQLAAEGLELEEIGGDIQVVEVSATANSGLEKLEEALLLQAELMELRACASDELHAVVVEARVDRGRGPLATVVVRSGNLVPGAIVVVGTQWGRLRALRDMSGHSVESAGPATPVEIDGLRGLPEAGDYIQVVGSEERARKLSQCRRIRAEQKRLLQLKQRNDGVAAVTPAEDGAEEQISEKVELTLIVKADVQGTSEAVSQALSQLSSNQVGVNIILSGVGPVSKSDIDLAESCNAVIVGFNIGAMKCGIEAAARLAKVKVLKHRVIYHLLEDVGSLIIGMAPGIKECQVAGQAEVLNVFELKGKGRNGKGATKIAGCRVVDGRLQRSSRIRVLRSGELLFEGLMQSLKREQQDVDTVSKGIECGMIVEEWVNFEVGDVVQCITDFRRMPKFVSSQNGTARIEC